MKYSDAMQYIMDGVEEKKQKASVNEENSAQFEADYALLNQLKADLEVLKQKHKDYKRLEEKSREEFEEMVKKLAALQIRKDELESLGWKKISAVLTGKYEKQRAALDNDQLFAQVEMNTIKLNMRSTAERVKEAGRALKETRRAFDSQRKYMIDLYGEGNRFEREAENKNVCIRAVIKEIDEAIAAVSRIMPYGSRADESLTSESTWLGITDFVSVVSPIGGLAAEAMLKNRYDSAQDDLFMINSMLPIVVKELKDVIDAFRVYRTEYTDNAPYEDLNDEDDIDHSIEFIRVNTAAIENIHVYGQWDVQMLMSRMLTISSNLGKEKKLLSKELIKAPAGIMYMHKALET